MNKHFLKSVEIENFRSIEGRIRAPLDAQIVLVHGENGAGKTSLLSSIELCLTGKVLALERFDIGYEQHLLHRSATEGSLKVKVDQNDHESVHECVLGQSKALSQHPLNPKEASYFSERVYLPQSLLSQLLQIYQESGSNAGSPLAKFVGDLLGLDRLDALVSGLKPLSDVRNLRKAVDQWAEAETERDRRQRLVLEKQESLNSINITISSHFAELRSICDELGVLHSADLESLDSISIELNSNEDDTAYVQTLDRQITLSSIQRQMALFQEQSAHSLLFTKEDTPTANLVFKDWLRINGDQLETLRHNIELLMPSLRPLTDLLDEEKIASEALKREHQQLATQIQQARRDLSRSIDLQNDLESVRLKTTAIEREISDISSTAGTLASLISELSSHIQTDECPLCDRDFSELNRGSLVNHVRIKSTKLSEASARLMILGKLRTENHQSSQQLELELEEVRNRQIPPDTLVKIEARLAALWKTLVELEQSRSLIAEGSALRTKDLSDQRALLNLQLRDTVLQSMRTMLNDFAVPFYPDQIESTEGFQTICEKLALVLNQQEERLSKRLALRRKAVSHLEKVRSLLTNRKEEEISISIESAALERVSQSMRRAQALRSQGQSIRESVDIVRSKIIRRVFNENLNRIWRDLFVRLAPSEPFTPAFRIPEAGTSRLQPKLVTFYRDSGEYIGSPGSVLSAGNLNTAALTLFIALHLSTPEVLPWLILDDPVQSMDDVHIAHFAALLRTLAKEHGRQIVISVHERQLFEYLRLEFSPAYEEDSLLTLELSRRLGHDTVCTSHRYTYREETILSMIA